MAARSRNPQIAERDVPDVHTEVYYDQRIVESPTPKNYRIMYKNTPFHGELLEWVELRDIVIGPEQPGGPLKETPSSGYLLDMNKLDVTIAALTAIKKRHGRA